MSNLPREFWADREALLRTNICTHVSKRNEFEPGVRCYTADKSDKEFIWGMFAAFGFGVVWTLGLLFLTGRL